MDEPPDAAAGRPPAAGPETTEPTEAAMPPGTGSPPPQPRPSSEAGGRWQLRRSVRDRKVKGVAGGVAAAADLDPTLVRILFAVAALSGWGILAYLVLAVVLQDETVESPAGPLPREQRRMLRIGLGVVAVVAAVRLFDGWFFGGGDIGLPFLLIAVGAAVLWARRDQVGTPPLYPPPPPGTAGWPDPAAPGGGPAAWPVPPGPPLAAAPLRSGVDWRSTGHDLLRLAAAFVAVGAFLALLAGTLVVLVGAVPVRLPFLPLAVGSAGLLGLLVAVVRRSRPAAFLIPGGALAVAVALAVGLASFPGSAGNRVVVLGPGTPLLDRYEHSAGRLVLDLGDLRLEPNEIRRVVAEVGTGTLTVMVPHAVATEVTAHVGAGGATLFGRSQGGVGVDVNRSRPGLAENGRLELDLRVGLGEVTVEQAPEPTFETSCTVPAEAKGDGTDAVTCSHPGPLAGLAMSCSVMLVDPAAGEGGRAFCRRQGSFPPAVGLFATSCAVPADSDTARCEPLPAPRQADLVAFRAGLLPGAPSTTVGPLGTAPPTTAPKVDVGQLTCGEPDATGTRTCTPTPAASTTTVAPQSYRCREDPASRQVTCTPGP